MCVSAITDSASPAERLAEWHLPGFQAWNQLKAKRG
jgi:hypothetical protein